MRHSEIVEQYRPRIGWDYIWILRNTPLRKGVIEMNLVFLYEAASANAGDPQHFGIAGGVDLS